MVVEQAGEQEKKPGMGEVYDFETENDPDYEEEEEPDEKKMMKIRPRQVVGGAGVLKNWGFGSD